MIRAEHLQIGDWVKYTNPPYIQVASITKRKIGYHVEPNEPCTHYVRLCEVEPIPLTPEILEKNGFVLKSDGWIWCKEEGIEEQNYIFVQYRKGAEEVRICELNFVGIVQVAYKNLHYVHQLQHALRLCGINKTIEP